MAVKSARFLKPAEMELNEAAEYYESEKTGLGMQFLACLQSTLAQAIDFPEGGPLVDYARRRRDVRRYQFERPFPYDLIGTVMGAELVVLAVAHHKREPRYWISRVDRLKA